jgi:NAD(P)-dependent dehydrogenase (short-subunit alcohol dehydrogenase family)
MGSSLTSRLRKKKSYSPLAGRVALITGASQGIGLAIAEALAREGCNLILTARNQAKLDQAAKRLKLHRTRILTVACDVREPAQVEALMNQVRRNFRRLDILINNAGISHANLEVSKLPLETWQEVIETNLTGTFLVTQFALPLMKGGAAIVNNLSVAAKRVFTGASAYNSSKHGALGLTDTLREELRPRGIRVIALLAGAADTAIWDTLWPEAPRKKMMPAETVAEAVVNALALPANSTLEELTLRPSAGTL